MGNRARRALSSLRSLVPLCAALIACGEREPAPVVPPAPIAQGCLAGELEQLDGSCLPAGIPPEDCGAGFEPDGARGCLAILPAEPCPPGSMAVPGETVCRSLADCGDGPWGDIPLEPGAIFVDASYGGADADGTMERPFGDLASAVAAASSGGMIAIAAGSYPANLVLENAPLRIWGRCPSMVALVANGTQAALFFRTGMEGSEVRNLAISGPKIGILASGSANLLFDRLWLHDLGGRALDVEGALGPTAAILRDSLVEDATGSGVFVGAAELDVERSVIRGGVAVEGEYGWGIFVREAGVSPSRLTVRASLIERALDAGMLLSGSSAKVEETVVRDIRPVLLARSGWGIAVQDALEAPLRGELTLDRSIIEQSHQLGLFTAGSDVTVRRSVIRDTFALASDPIGARAIGVETNPYTGEPSTIVVEQSLLERHDGLGVFVSGSTARITSTIVRHIFGGADAAGGIGINARVDDDGTRGSSLELVGSVVSDCQLGGISGEGSAVVIDRSLVAHIAPRAGDGAFGRGINVQSSAGLPSALWLGRSRIGDVHEGGLVILDSDAEVYDTLIERVFARPNDALFGDGISLYSLEAPATLAVGGTIVRNAARAALSSFGGSVSVGASRFECSAIFLAAEPGPLGEARFEAVGETTCGCEAKDEPCHVLSSGLAPPSPIAAVP